MARLIKNPLRNDKYYRIPNPRVRYGYGILFRLPHTSVKKQTPTDEKDTVDCPTATETSGLRRARTKNATAQYPNEVTIDFGSRNASP